LVKLNLKNKTVKMDEKNINKVILGIVIVGLVLVISIYIISQMGTVMRDDVTLTGTNTNETVIRVNDSVTKSFAILSTQPAARCTVSNVYNATNGIVIIATGNYTQATSCQIASTVASPFKNYNWNVTYSYAYDTTAATGASNASDDVVSALSSGTPWLTILLVVAFAVVVLGMLIGGLGGAASGKTGPTY
jgi:Na+-transporting methylmalonyl-CoA/oxaloacetate decarboxylase gamma subunit